MIEWVFALYILALLWLCCRPLCRKIRPDVAAVAARRSQLVTMRSKITDDEIPIGLLIAKIRFLFNFAFL
jgi:hypothetical protein